MRTFSSPSVTSISAMPDSSTKSISFFNLRKSMFLPIGLYCQKVKILCAPQRRLQMGNFDDFAAKNPAFVRKIGHFCVKSKMVHFRTEILNCIAASAGCFRFGGCLQQIFIYGCDCQRWRICSNRQTVAAWAMFSDSVAPCMGIFTLLPASAMSSGDTPLPSLPKIQAQGARKSSW